MQNKREDTRFQILANLAEICAQKNIRHVIISPGSRSAPLTVAFARQPELQCRVVIDERAAGFIALGLAQQTRRPTILVCTSGTAALNYGPAVTEAFYQQIPLLVFTADRPPEWIDQQDGQTIHQSNLYGPHSRGSFALPVDYNHPDAQWQAERLISEAINRAVWPTPGPVQINAPFREPLYPAPDTVYSAQPGRKIIDLAPVQATLSDATWRPLLSEWQQARRKLVVAGLQPPQPALADMLNRLQLDPSVAVIADITANLAQTGLNIHHSDMILGTKTPETLEKLAPDLVVSLGGPLVSKYLKLFLRKVQPGRHWHLRPDGQPIDTFQALTQVIPADPLYFFRRLVSEPSSSKNGTGPATETYQQTWLTLEAQARQTLAGFLAEVPFGEFQAVQQVLQALPEGSHLQLGNSMPIRYANLISLDPGSGPQHIRVNANRGTSGIDGTLSTAVGAALATGEITTLITGDLAFFYDRNALWHNHLPPNLRIVVLNNQGGGIFKLIDGPTNLAAAELEALFFTPQPLTAKNTAADHGCAYFRADEGPALAQHLPAFFAGQTGPAILEIFTDSDLNANVFREFKARIAKLTINIDLRSENNEQFRSLANA